MNPLYPIHTEKTECQDCYKCVRECPVKAIQVRDGHASIIDERCILCGHCVNICPVAAKKTRNDIKRTKQLIQRKEQVFVSLAPSWVSAFEQLESSQMVHVLKSLGFSAVSETALGAQEVSAHVAGALQHSNSGLMISSACPTVVLYLHKYRPRMAEYITPFCSPVLAHARMLRAQAGRDIGVVFIGPCISKKIEADSNPELLDLALTFNELKTWLDETGIHPRQIQPESGDSWFPEPARQGSLYPVDGGMIAGIQSSCPVNAANCMTFSGIGNIRRAVTDLNEMPLTHSLFLELLACEGGCVNGPCTSGRDKTIFKRLRVISQARYANMDVPGRPHLDISHRESIDPVVENDFTESQIEAAMRDAGKYSEKDELNCGGCGYDSCRAFAAALLGGHAEKTMCVSFMRKLAQKKANALLKAMPSGVVMVNDAMKIVECNARFARLAGEQAQMAYGASPGMEGAALEKVVPFAHLFQHVLHSGQDILDKDIHGNGTILHASIFGIEPHRLVCGILQDITVPAVQKEQVIRRTRQVIEKNMGTVQQIAYLLGENASETQMMLDSIIRSFSTGEEPE